MRGIVAYIVACVFAVAAPLVPGRADFDGSTPTFNGWPTRYEGRPLKRLPLSKREEGFARGFPGHIAKFADRNATVIIRWVDKPTRKLHPAVDCFKGMGYSVRPATVRIDRNGNRWGRFEARSANERLLVSERMYDSRGGSWTDVSSWYWAALLRRTGSPWWAVTVAEPANGPGKRIGESNMLPGSHR